MIRRIAWFIFDNFVQEKHLVKLHNKLTKELRLVETFISVKNYR